MPELPEVETVCRGLNQILHLPVEVEAFELRRKDLRVPIPLQLKKQLPGKKIEKIWRRAKYLLWEAGEVTLISHLGMSGSWRLRELGEEPRLHDHIFLHLRDGRCLAYNDPRRFGLLDAVEKGQEGSSAWLAHLGPEPLDEEAFTADYLWSLARGRKTKIKNLIMDQRVVVGVGNIYASEALFLAGVRPGRAAGRLTRREVASLVLEIRRILRQAIDSGGSSIRDFRSALQHKGDFQEQLQVYGRGGQPCRQCGGEIRQALIGGRSSYWCSQCQT